MTGAGLAAGPVVPAPSLRSDQGPVRLTGAAPPRPPGGVGRGRAPRGSRTSGSRMRTVQPLGKAAITVGILSNLGRCLVPRWSGWSAQPNRTLTGPAAGLLLARPSSSPHEARGPSGIRVRVLASACRPPGLTFPCHSFLPTW